MKRVLSSNPRIDKDEEVLQHKKRRISHSEPTNPCSILDSTTFLTHENLQFGNKARCEDVVIKEEFINSYSDGEEIFSNDENFKIELETFKKETESFDELSMENLVCNKRNLQSSDSSDERAKTLKKVKEKCYKTRKLKNYKFSAEDNIDFEKALQNCTNSHQKSQLVERKKIEKQTGELTIEEITLLKQLNIEIPWPVPICHSIETRVSSYPTKQQKEQFSKLGIKFATGPYSNEENLKIKENWSEFCKSHNIEENSKLFLNFVWEGKAYLPKQQRINFVRYLAQGLEHRPLWSVYERFQRLFSETQRGNFTPKEDDIIMAFYENSEFLNKNSALASVLNRSRVSIKNRYKILKTEDSKIKFTDEMDQTFLDNIMMVTGKTCISELRDVELDINHYKEIASKMNIQYTKLKRRWELTLKLRLFVEDYTFVQDIREKLINLLSESKLTDRRAINWKQLAKHFENITSSKLYKVFSDLTSSYVPEHRQKSLTDIIECLKHSKNHMTNKKLQKYSYEGKKLIFETSRKVE